jgi:GNAT superfamily N-acetyltransferase
VAAWPGQSVVGLLRQLDCRQEVQLAFYDDELAGTLRLLMSDPIVWPEVTGDDAVYVYNLGVRRRWAGHDLGGRLLNWAEGRAASLGRRFVRLDCRRDNAFLSGYYERKGFVARGEVDARYPHPVGLELLCWYEKAVHA